MELAEFLLARIAEDEAALAAGRALGVPPLPGGSRIFSGIGNHPTVTETRLAAECEAKRRIVEFYAGPHGQPYVLHFLAAAYGDHPDYNPEWTR